jgi:hypothetical protein
MMKAFQVEAPVDKEVSEPLFFADAEAAGLAFCLSHVQKYLALLFAQRKRKHVGLVGLVAILFVHPLRERVAADHKGELEARAEYGARYFFKRNMRNGAADRSFGGEHYRLVSERNKCLH